MSAKVNQNERSCVIELISKINSFVASKNLMIKHAGGERTISIGRATMFPDVILYGDCNQQFFLQGWEAKMPDVSIDDETFVKDAQRKAIALNLNSCLIWNFSYAVLYVRAEANNFVRVKSWDETNFIKTREDVSTFHAEWVALVEKIILEVNEYFVAGKFRKSLVSDAISTTTVSSIIERNKSLLADELKSAAVRNSIVGAYVDEWWRESHIEYQHDEVDAYVAYAKIVILNWLNRILFAHIIKRYHNGAMQINQLGESTSPNDANAMFQSITQKCDFYNVFAQLKFNDILPAATWRDCVDLSLFLLENGISSIDQSSLQNVLEGTVGIGKRELNGQFATPPILARILAELTVRDWSDFVLDPCCGTGTIAKAVLDIKKSKINIRDAVATTWAFDKNNFPLQVANISMIGADTINLPSLISVQNALTLKVGKEIEITNPVDGATVTFDLPKFGAVVSNLPFVAFEHIADEDKVTIEQDKLYCNVNGRCDLYCYIILKLSEMVKPGAFVGVITSNAWMGTLSGESFIEEVKKNFDIHQIHISANGRWFHNADVVATILILKRKDDTPAQRTQFFSWQQPLTSLESDLEACKKLVHSALLATEIDDSVVKMASYTDSQIADLRSINISYNAFFHNVDWVRRLPEKLVAIGKVYNVFRGSRRGWDELFYPFRGEHNIEHMYLRKVLKNARDVNHFTAVADSDAFCCSESLEKLSDKGHQGAVSWIMRFADKVNGKGILLPEVLKRKGMQWYELQENEVAEVFTMMNPDRRLFFARFEQPSFVNQRLVGLRHNSDYADEDLNFALLNSLITMFFIEASGFGRGLGVLDINSKTIANCRMLNPSLVSNAHRESILKSFDNLSRRSILDVAEELHQNDRMEFEKAVFAAFGIEACLEPARQSLLSMQASRHSVR